MLKKVLVQSFLLVLIPFIFYYLISVLFEYSIPKLSWPVKTNYEREFYLEIESYASLYNIQRLWQHFDSNYYMEIALNGYVRNNIPHEGRLLNWAFYPLYPLMVGLVGYFFSISTSMHLFYVGVVVSNIFLFLSYVFLYTFLRKIGLDYKDWIRIAILILVFPAAYFKQIFYTESLYLFLSLLCLNLIFSKKFFFASLVIAFLGATRLYGLTLFIPLFSYQLFLFSQSNYKHKNLLGLFIKNFIYGLISISLFSVFIWYLYYLTGEWFISFIEQSSARGGGMVYPFKSIVEFFIGLKYFDPYAYLDWILNIAVSIIGFISLFYLPFIKSISKEYRIPLFLYGISYMLLPLSTKDNISIFRYVSVLVPMYLVIHLLTKEKDFVFYLLLFMFAFLQSFFLLLFVGHYVIPTYGV